VSAPLAGVPAPRPSQALSTGYRRVSGKCRADRLNPAPQLFLALILLNAGCGYISTPTPPLANIPQRISDLAAVQRGAIVIVHFTVPTMTTENHPLQKSVKLDLRVGLAGDHFNTDTWANQAKAVPPGTIEAGIVTYKIPTQDWTGKLVAIGARSIGANGKKSGWSNVEAVAVVPPPETPSKPDVQDIALGEHITWTGNGDQFRILRRIGDEGEFTIANTVSGHEWTETGVEYGKPYTYMVQALVETSNKRIAESDLSEARTRTPEDTFPPAVPSGLRADRTGNGVALVWEPDSDADLAGYRVYRSEGTGPWQKLADVNAVPTYTDTAVEPGKAYRYAVTAFDKAAKVNESERCAPVEIAIP
jgi:hypothetical protein